MNRWISAIARWWRAEHPPLARLPDWKRAQEAEKRAAARRNTQAVHRAREAKRAALHSNLRGVVCSSRNGGDAGGEC